MIPVTFWVTYSRRHGPGFSFQYGFHSFFGLENKQECRHEKMIFFFIYWEMAV